MAEEQNKWLPPRHRTSSWEENMEGGSVDAGAVGHCAGCWRDSRIVLMRTTNSAALSALQTSAMLSSHNSSCRRTASPAAALAAPPAAPSTNPAPARVAVASAAIRERGLGEYPDARCRVAVAPAAFGGHGLDARGCCVLWFKPQCSQSCPQRFI